MSRQLRVKRVYDPGSPEDGYRVLVDRLWPRGISRQELGPDDWPRVIAPSTELRKWFHAHPSEFDAFARRFEAELDANPEALAVLSEVAGRLERGPVTLLTAARASPNHATVLQRRILGLPQGSDGV